MTHVLMASGLAAGVTAFTTLGGPGAINYGLACGASVPQALGAREALSLALGRRIRWLDQVHGTAISSFGDTRERPCADASVSDDPSEALAILTADCLPVLLASSCGTVVGAAHAGWRGLAAGVLQATLQELNQRCPGATWQAWIGPSIGPKAYEVGAEVRDAFLAQGDALAEFFEPEREHHWRADLPGIAQAILRRHGVAQVTQSGQCTLSDAQRWFSYRRDHDQLGLGGRMVSIIAAASRRPT